MDDFNWFDMIKPLRQKITGLSKASEQNKHAKNKETAFVAL
jgi:hypothetical protein